MSDAAPKSGDYLDGKLWFHRKGNLLTLGLTSLGLEDLGNIQGIDFPDEGDDFSKSDVIVTVDGSAGSVEVICPASGLIQEVNSALQSEPERLTEDPLEEGWLVKLQIEDPTELKEFL
jgi:glycine cleavage system H protein